jgi:hypothetical protein
MKTICWDIAPRSKQQNQKIFQEKTKLLKLKQNNTHNSTESDDLIARGNIVLLISLKISKICCLLNWKMFFFWYLYFNTTQPSSILFMNVFLSKTFICGKSKQIVCCEPLIACCAISWDCENVVDF